MKLQDHEKFIAFILLGAGLLGLATLIYLHPLPDSAQNSGVLQILNMIIGALIGAFGGAANALFRTNDKVIVDNPQNKPVPVEPTE